MKRSEVIALIVSSIEIYNENDPNWLNRIGMEKQKEQAYRVASNLLFDLEQIGMYYCPVVDLGDFGKLRTPKMWEEE